MTVSSNVPAPSLPVVGPDGRMSPVWFQFFMTLFRRTGDTQGNTADDQNLAADGGDGLAEIVAQLFSVRDAMHMTPPTLPAIPNDDQTPTATPAQPPDDPSGRIEALEAVVQRLQFEVEALRQGQQL